MDFEKEQKEIRELKKELEIKEKVFELIRKDTKESKEKAKQILEKDSKLLSYFIKFKTDFDKDGRHAGKVILLGVGQAWSIVYRKYYENEILEDLDKLRKELSEREYLLQQKIFLEQQREFLEVQKKDIEENKKDREKMNNFTFVLALGVLATVVFYMFQTFVQFKTSSTLHILLFSGICCLAFTLLFIFVLNSFDMGEKLLDFWKKRKWLIIFLALLIGLFSIYLMTFQDKPTTTAQKGELELLSQTNQEIQNVNQLINQSLTEQNEINTELKNILLNQINSNQNQTT